MAESNEVMAMSSAAGEMEFRLENPTEDKFLKKIEWNREELEAVIRAKAQEYKGMVYTEDTMKQAKKDRADLNKLVKAIEERKRSVKKTLMEPYETFDKEVSEVVALIKEPASLIARQIKEYEEQQKAEKRQKLQAVYDENIGELADVLPFEKVFRQQYLNATFSLGKASGEIVDAIGKVKNDLETIAGLDTKFQVNVRDVYIRTLDLSKALAENNRLQKLEAQMEAERKRKEEEARRKEEEQAKRKEEGRRRKEEESRIAQEKAQSASQDNASRKELSAADTQMQETSALSGEAVSENHAMERQEEPVTNPFAGNEQGEKQNSGEGHATSMSDSGKKCKAKFYAIGTREQLKALKQYMVEQGIDFGKVE